MPYNEQIASRVREELAAIRKVDEKKMMGGLTFMVNDKMCVGVLHDDIMVRLAPEEYEQALSRKGCREMTFTGKPMKGFVFVGPDGIRGKKELRYWIDLALAYNKTAKSSKKKK
jgi:TfoX/Sxy family transcriptional regulator of competence genes